jgi:CRP/FNR family transcriptional regulator
MDNERLATLRRAPLLAALDEEALRALVSRCRSVRVPAGRQIIHAGEVAHAFFVVLAGRIKVYKLSPRGDEQVLHHYGVGSTFGEAAVLAGNSFPAFAESLEPSELLEISRDTLLRAVSQQPELALAMLAGLSGKLREFAHLIEQLSLKEVPARLADALLELGDRAGADTFELNQSKRQLAAQLGTVAETLSRAFRKLRADGLISVDGATISILDRSRLRRLAEHG